MNTYLIAEIGVNHNGSIDVAKKLIRAAKRSGASAVKFQSFKTHSIVSKQTPLANYQKENNPNLLSQYDLLKSLELSFEQQRYLQKYCKKIQIDFISSPFDQESLDDLVNLDLKIIKIPSGEITNMPLLRKIGGLNKNLILSTGLSNMTEISDAIDILTNSGTSKKNISILHANTMYPTPYEDVNLSAMINIKETFSLDVGYSDHTLGIQVSLAAVTLGAKIIEKHFTLSRDLTGPDHKASIEPHELEEMVKGIKIIETVLGSRETYPTKSEIKNLNAVRKSIVASQFIRKGEVFSNENLTTKRPGDGISPMLWDSVIGTEAKYDFYLDDKIIL